MSEADRPLLNPVLQLNMESRREVPTGGGKGRNTVVTERLRTQQVVLSSAARELYGRRDDLQAYGGGGPPPRPPLRWGPPAPPAPPRGPLFLVAGRVHVPPPPAAAPRVRRRPRRA